jgi:hypothetical protein
MAELSQVLGLHQSEVKQILQNCERNLYRALKALRDNECHDLSEDTLHSIVYAAAGCLR